MDISPETARRPDRRRERTQRQLGDALIALILERGYDDIRIEDITDRANLGRATFYLHFHGGKDELLLLTLQRVIDELVDQIQAMPLSQIGIESPFPSQIAFEHAAKHRDLYRVLLRSHSAHRLSARLREHIALRIEQRFADRLAAVGIEMPLVPAPIIAHYLSSALFGVLEWWLERGDLYDVDTMAAMVRQMHMAAIMAAIGVEGT
ncbi:MAG: TetR/AcrR family transcriptional regulator [Chloroflexota bacterium]|nr:TetR/AcrR family transcriptional regulator [Chloroflexota bacterium]